MSKAGSATFKGANSQALAAMSLFFQFLKDPRFDSIQLEGENFEDFTIFFNDDKKIFCEAKDRKQKFSYPQLKEVLDNVEKRGQFNSDDKILVICTNANSNLVSEVKNFKFYPGLAKKFTSKGFEDKILPLLGKVDFWVVPPSFNEDVIYSLFADVINFWVPPEQIKQYVNNLLVQEIYKGSANGKRYSRIDVSKAIEKFKEDVQKSSDYFNSKIKKEKQFKALEKTVNSNGRIPWGTSSIAAFSTRFDLMSFAADRLKSRKNLVLKNWNDLWQLNQVRYFTYGIFDIFENNLVSDQNIKYILSYIKRNTKKIRGFYYSDFFDMDVVKVLTKIVDLNKVEYVADTFLIIKDLITFNEKEFFYIKNSGYDHDHWEKGEICKLLHKTYDKADEGLKSKIFNLILKAFNITEDDGEFSNHAPRDVYEILNSWLSEDFSRRFDKFVRIVSDQYDRYYKRFGKKLAFNGWEHMGGGVSFSGSYHASDRHFVGFILAPAIRKFYDKDKAIGWKFIKQKCITRENKVSKIRPDFLNRSVYEIVLERYADDNHKVSEEALSILKEFIESRKGIPHKTDLIYQAVVGSNLSDDKRWNLIKLTTKYGYPVNPFVEQIVAGLAKKGHAKSRAELQKWFKEPKYYNRFMFGEDAVSTIKTLMGSDFDFAMSLFMALLEGDYFKSTGKDNLSPFVVAGLLHEVIKINYEKGLEFIRFLESQDTLTKDQQSIYCYSFYDNHGNDDSEDSELLIKIYNDVVDPFLSGLDDDVIKVCERISNDGARGAIVQFATRLAAKKKVSEAIRIIRVFINDPDPYLSGQDPNDPENKYNENKRIEDGKEPSSITSVRGWCGWALMKCAILEGREQIPEVIKLSKDLALNDPENYYVIHMACFSLAQIARQRLTVLPSNRSVLFFGDDKSKALKMAKEVEAIAFILLEKLLSWPESVQKAMAKSILHLFDPIRALNEADSLKLVNALSNLPVGATEESSPLFIYFAEFRKEAYRNWKFSLPGLYDDLQPSKYNAKKFKQILIDTVKKLQQQDPDSCFRFAASVEHMMREAPQRSGDLDRYTKLAIEYFNLLTDTYGHGIYNLIYRVIQDKITVPDAYQNQWYVLLVKCLKNEKVFYEQAIKAGNASKVYWYPALYHSAILELVNKNMGEVKFMEVAKIFFSFPKELELHESDSLVAVIKNLASAGKNKEAKVIIKYLKDKNPSKYWEIDKK